MSVSKVPVTATVLGWQSKVFGPHDVANAPKAAMK